MDRDFFSLAGWFTILVIVLFSHSLAHAQAYKYRDREGKVHYTDAYESIPPEYRDRVITMDFPSSTSQPKSRPETSQENSADPDLYRKFFGEPEEEESSSSESEDLFELSFDQEKINAVSYPKVAGLLFMVALGYALTAGGFQWLASQPGADSAWASWGMILVFLVLVTIVLPGIAFPK